MEVTRGDAHVRPCKRSAWRVHTRRRHIGAPRQDLLPPRIVAARECPRKSFSFYFSTRFPRARRNLPDRKPPRDARPRLSPDPNQTPFRKEEGNEIV